MTVKISSIFVAFFENINFTTSFVFNPYHIILPYYFLDTLKVWFASSWLCLHVLYRFFIIFLSPKVKYSCELFEHEEQHHKRCEGGLLYYTHMSTLVSVRLLSFFYFWGVKMCDIFLNIVHRIFCILRTISAGKTTSQTLQMRKRYLFNLNSRDSRSSKSFAKVL